MTLLLQTGQHLLIEFREINSDNNYCETLFIIRYVFALFTDKVRGNECGSSTLLREVPIEDIVSRIEEQRTALDIENLSEVCDRFFAIDIVLEVSTDPIQH